MILWKIQNDKRSFLKSQLFSYLLFVKLELLLDERLHCVEEFDCIWELINVDKIVLILALL